MNAETEKLIANHDASVKHRARMEVGIIRLTISSLLAAGYTVTVDNGGDEEVTGTPPELLAEIMGVDEGRLIAWKDAKVTWVFFVLGNDGYDVICDYHIGLEDAIKPANDYADRLAEGGPLED